MYKTVAIHSIRLAAKYYPAVVPHLSHRARWMAAPIVPDTKTYAHYLRQITQAVAALYAGDISAGEFVDRLAEVIPQQLTRAWNEGMRANELDPAADMTEEWAAQLEDIILSEFDYVDGFAADIAKGAQNGAGVDQYKARAELWANRYNDTVSEAKLATADAKDKYEWIFGDTDHCSTCEQLNGIVASAGEWEQSGFRPQQPPNDLLQCGGWKCQCRLEPTDKRRTPKALSTLLDLATGQNV